MADLYGVNYTKSEVNIPKDKIPHAEVNGRPHVGYDEYTFLAEIANGDVVYLSKIPAGARITKVTVVTPSLGTTGTVDVGVVGDADKFAAALAVNGGAVAIDLPSLKKTTVEEQLILTGVAATDAATGLTIQVAVEFIVA